MSQKMNKGYRNTVHTKSHDSPTISDIARASGVSTATVSYILNGSTSKASKETRQRVHDAVERLGYRPNQVGRSLRKHRSAMVALLIPDNRNAFYASIADAAQRSITKSGYAMTLCNTREDPQSQDAYIEEMRSHLVSGIVLLGAVKTPGLKRLCDNGPPTLFVNRKCPIDNKWPFIGIDNYAAGQDVAQYFIDKGYTDCSALHGPCTSSASKERFEGFYDRLSDYGIELPSSRTLECRLTAESGYQQADCLLREAKPPQAVFCGNDPIAYGLYRRCHELGLRVPEDVAIFGFDDNPLNEWLAPWLSTVHIPLEELGYQISETMDRLLSNSGEDEYIPKHYLPYTLQVRTSA